MLRFYAVSALFHALLLGLLWPQDGSFADSFAIQVEYKAVTSAGWAPSGQYGPNYSLKPGSSVEAVKSVYDRGNLGSSPTVVFGHDLGISVQYPRISRLLGEEGEVKVEVHRSRDQVEARVLSSSGYPLLDEAALAAIKSAINLGLLKHLLTIHEEQVQISFIFKLRRDL
ncbi:MAG: TonB family protein [Bdellovibrionaceae bacterium]|nr:TonB family protein [Pseudobdellovibrionaceae bacterium]